MGRPPVKGNKVCFILTYSLYNGVQELVRKGYYENMTHVFNDALRELLRKEGVLGTESESEKSRGAPSPRQVENPPLGTDGVASKSKEASKEEVPTV